VKNINEMTEELLKMKVGEMADKSHFNYDSFITTKTRLKRNGKGEWQSKLTKGQLTVRRTA